MQMQLMRELSGHGHVGQSSCTFVKLAFNSISSLHNRK